MALLDQFESLREEAYAALDADRSSLGQFYTPPALASLLASMIEAPLPRSVSLLDPGAGVGILSAAAVMKLHGLGVRAIDLTVCELAPEVVPMLRKGLELISRWCREHQVNFRVSVIENDFTKWAVDQVAENDLFTAPEAVFDVVILNPPYRKISADGAQRRLLQRAGLECSNLYAGFIHLAARLLRDRGQLVSINPRSFANGPYFRDFRRHLFATTPLRAVHVFARRDRAFSSDKVLQENILIHAVRGEPTPNLRIYSSEAGESAIRAQDVPRERAIDPKDADQILHLEVTGDDRDVTDQIRALPATLATLGIQVSTGRVVDFRVRDGLRRSESEGTVPLIYPQHLRNATVVWPNGKRKADYFEAGSAYAAQLVPAGTYVLTKRFTAKEERRRISAAVISQDIVPGSHYALENHLNYFHAFGQPLDPTLAVGLTAFLNSTLADRYFRLYNGHTQVNATDLRAMPYPPSTALRQLGRTLRGVRLTTENVDPPVIALCLTFAKKKNSGSPVHSPRPRRSSRAA